eukprot:5699707-Amphidinium_carterae.1
MCLENADWERLSAHESTTGNAGHAKVRKSKAAAGLGVALLSACIAMMGSASMVFVNSKQTFAARSSTQPATTYWSSELLLGRVGRAAQAPGSGEVTVLPHVKNMLGEPLEACSLDPLTGWYRDGFCQADENDAGSHFVCVQTTTETPYVIACAEQ